MPPGLKRWIVRTHTYLGVAFAALSVMWFASGIVLAYNTFPVLLDADRLRLAPPLNCAACLVSESEARRVTGNWRGRTTSSPITVFTSPVPILISL